MNIRRIRNWFLMIWRREMERSSHWTSKRMFGVHVRWSRCAIVTAHCYPYRFVSFRSRNAAASIKNDWSLYRQIRITELWSWYLINFGADGDSTRRRVLHEVLTVDTLIVGNPWAVLLIHSESDITCLAVILLDKCATGNIQCGTGKNNT
jgi:hypothetical protein